MLLVIGAVARRDRRHARLPAHRDRRGPHRPHGARHGVLVQLFLAAMALAVLADNLGLLWVAIEATTIITAFLVGHAAPAPRSRRPGSTW